jgi:tetratricopeptide (TPR) repeat protein
MMVATVAVILVWFATAQADRIVVEPISIAKGPLEDSVESPQLTAQFAHALLRLLNEADSQARAPNFGPAPEPPEIDVPLAEVSLGSLIKGLGTLLGFAPTRIYVTVIQSDQPPAVVFARVSGPPLERDESVRVSNDDLAIAIDQAAREVVLRIAPVILASYCRSHRGECEPTGALQYAMQHDPVEDDHWALNTWAAVLIERGELSAAEEKIKHALALEPTFGLAWFNFGVLRAMQGQPDQAIAFYRNAVHSGDRYARSVAYNNLGQLLVSRQPVKAREAFEAALRDNPGLADAYLNLGNYYFSVRLPDAAVSHYSRAAALESSNPFPLICTATAYEHMGRVGDARNLYLESVRVAPTDPMAAYYLADFYRRQGEDDEAKSAFARVLAIADPTSKFYTDAQSALAALSPGQSKESN